MGHGHEVLSKADEIVKRGDDFFKIDLFLTAKKTYEKALLQNPEHPEIIQEKINKCNENIKRDTVKVLITVPIVAAVIFAIYYLSCF